MPSNSPTQRERDFNVYHILATQEFGLVYWGLAPQQQPGSYQGGEMMMMKSVFCWRKRMHRTGCSFTSNCNVIMNISDPDT